MSMIYALSRRSRGQSLSVHRACAGNVGNLPMVLVAALCEDQSSAVAHAVAPGRCYELGIAYVVFAMWVAGEQIRLSWNIIAEPSSLTLACLEWCQQIDVALLPLVGGKFMSRYCLRAGLFQFSVAYALLKPSPETLEVRPGFTAQKPKGKCVQCNNVSVMQPLLVERL